jgi:hydrogenase maturation factor HypF (carbamoyltransferase family)
MRLVRETVTGNPSVVMSHSIAVCKQFLQELADEHVERYGYGH